MQHTPYGYDIVDGKAVVNVEQADNLKKICENYLGGMGYIAAARDVGLSMQHCGVKLMIENKKYLGDDFYPQIITMELHEKVVAERLKRSKALGRDRKKKKERKQATIPTKFSMTRIQNKYDNPIEQAEYAYGLIKEVKR